MCKKDTNLPGHAKSTEGVLQLAAMRSGRGDESVSKKKSICCTPKYLLEKRPVGKHACHRRQLSNFQIDSREPFQHTLQLLRPVNVDKCQRPNHLHIGVTDHVGLST